MTAIYILIAVVTAAFIVAQHIPSCARWPTLSPDGSDFGLSVFLISIAFLIALMATVLARLP